MISKRSVKTAEFGMPRVPGGSRGNSRAHAISEKQTYLDVRRPKSEAPEFEAFPEHRSLDGQDGVARKAADGKHAENLAYRPELVGTGGHMRFWKKHANRRSGPGIRTS